MFKAAVTATVLLLFPANFCGVALGGPPPVQECDRLAANPGDLQKVAGVAGVMPAERIDSEFALPACREAVRKYPYEPRFAYQLGRVLWVVGRFREAAAWYNKAAQKNYAAAYMGLGLMYRLGQGVQRDLPKALSLYQQAIEAGSPSAMVNLAWMYFNGEGIAKNPVKGIKLLQRAATEEYALAQMLLAQVYETGKLVEQDLSAALYWYRQAEKNGHPGATEKIAAVNKMMTAPSTIPGETENSRLE